MLSEIVPGIVQAVQREDDELREGCLQALETLLLRCPTEVAPYVTSITQAGNQFIKYDPVSALVLSSSITNIQYSELHCR